MSRISEGPPKVLVWCENQDLKVFSVTYQKYVCYEANDVICIQDICVRLLKDDARLNQNKRKSLNLLV